MGARERPERAARGNQSYPEFWVVTDDIGMYPIVDKYGSLSYQVELSSKLLGIYSVFHVSQLKRCEPSA
jgi:hypothetical protein